jgi:hypothetical protein
MKSTKIIVIDALLAAIASVILSFGSLLGDLDLTFAALASVAVFIALIEVGLSSAIAVWLVTSLLSGILRPSAAVLMFACFVGLYPIIKLTSEKLRPILAWTFKIISVNIATVVITLLSELVFFPGESYAWWIYLLTLLLANLATVMFDYVLSKFAVLYFSSLRKKLGFKDTKK